MKSKEDTTCVFYEEGCTVYQERPRACRLFPFRVEEETTSEGDILLNISYNPTCPGIGIGIIIDKKELEKLVVDQFLQRTESIAPQIQRLSEERSKGARSTEPFPAEGSEIDRLFTDALVRFFLNVHKYFQP
jgi:hypothetical protein